VEHKPILTAALALLSGARIERHDDFGRGGAAQTGVGFCTGICITSADCPNTWTCQPLAEGVSVCASPF